MTEPKIVNIHDDVAKFNSTEHNVLGYLALFFFSVAICSLGYIFLRQGNEDAIIKTLQTEKVQAEKALVATKQINTNLNNQLLILEDSLNDSYNYITLIENGTTKIQHDKIKAINTILNAPIDTSDVIRAIANLKHRYNIR